MQASPDEILKGGVDPSADQTSSWRAPTSACPRILQKIMSFFQYQPPTLLEEFHEKSIFSRTTIFL